MWVIDQSFNWPMGCKFTIWKVMKRIMHAQGTRLWLCLAISQHTCSRQQALVDQPLVQHIAARTSDPVQSGQPRQKPPRSIRSTSTKVGAYENQWGAGNKLRYVMIDDDGDVPSVQVVNTTGKPPESFLSKRSDRRQTLMDSRVTHMYGSYVFLRNAARSTHDLPTCMQAHAARSPRDWFPAAVVRCVFFSFLFLSFSFIYSLFFPFFSFFFQQRPVGSYACFLFFYFLFFLFSFSFIFLLHLYIYIYIFFCFMWFSIILSIFYFDVSFLLFFFFFSFLCLRSILSLILFFFFISFCLFALFFFNYVFHVFFLYFLIIFYFLVFLFPLFSFFYFLLIFLWCSMCGFLMFMFIKRTKEK